MHAKLSFVATFGAKFDPIGFSILDSSFLHNKRNNRIFKIAIVLFN